MDEIIGLVPAAGRGTRISPLPGSKELFPVGFRPLGKAGSPRPKVVCHYLLERMAAAGIGRVFMGLAPGKWDVAAYLGSGEGLGVRLAYLVVPDSPCTPHTLNTAYPFVKDSLVALGFPDIIFDATDAYQRLIARYRQRRADVTLGLFGCDRPETADVVTLEDSGAVKHIDVKPAHPAARLTWGVALWTPLFSEFMHSFMAADAAAEKDSGSGELHVGHVVQAAIDGGLAVDSVMISEAPFLDIGIPDNLRLAVQRYAARES